MSNHIIRMNFLTLKRFTLMMITYVFIISIILNLHPSGANAHSYSASFTNINFTNEYTEIQFSLDTLSILELRGDVVDVNKNGIIEPSEVKDEEKNIEEFINQFLVVTKNNENQTPEFKDMKIEMKDNKEFVTSTISYPAFFPGDAISLMDAFYTNNDLGANYINLLSATNRGETSQAILEGDNRTWTILLTEVQLEQGAEESEQTEQSIPIPESTKEPTNHSWYFFSS